MPTLTRTVTSPDQYELQPLGRSTLLNKIYVGFVKDTKDEQHMGRIRVWIPEIGGDPRNESSWLTVTYASPFAGATNVYANTNGKTYLDSQRSYGMWFVPPDLENEVVCCFINGDPGRGVWFACLFQQNMNHMVPGLPGNNSSDGLPVGEYNKVIKETDTKNPKRPEYKPLADALRAQGLDADNVRGIGNSGARRENPSAVLGILSPGGSQFVIDDNTVNSFIRLRTQNGAQIMINNTTGEIYMITSQGNNWFSMTSDGTVNLFGTDDINIRSNTNLNLRADLDVNIEAGRNMFVKVRGDSEAEKATDGGGMFKMNANASVHLSSNGEFFQSSAGNMHRLSNASIYDFAGGNANYKATATTNIQSDGADVMIKAKGEIHETATNIHFNGPTATDAAAAIAATVPQEFTIVDNVNTSNGYQKITRQSILYNLPYHEPYDHSEDVKTGITDGNVEKGNPENDPSVQIVRSGELVKNQQIPTDIVQGTPKAGMEPGVYKGVAFDSKGNPVYEKVSTDTGLNPASSYRMSDDGKSWLKKNAEGILWRITPDGKGHYSIGYGHQLTNLEYNGRYVMIDGNRVNVETVITQRDADALFEQDIKTRGENLVKAGITARLTQSQFDALVSFAYNTGHMAGTDLAKAINTGNMADVPKGFYNWINSDGKPKLLGRRRKEASWFLTGVRPPS